MERRIDIMADGQQVWIEQPDGMVLGIVGSVDSLAISKGTSKAEWQDLKESMKTNIIGLDKSGNGFTIKSKKQDTKQ